MPALGYVNIDYAPVSQADVDTLINVYGVHVDGTPAGGTLLSDIVFADAELEQCIRENRPGIVTTGQLRWLDCNWRPVSDISDLALFTNLQEVYLAGTSVTDISPLFSLPNLTWVDINESPVPQEQIDTLTDAGVGVGGTPLGGALLSGLSFADAELQACVDLRANENGWITTEQVWYLDCNYLPISDLSDIGQLEGITGLGLAFIDATDFTPVADLTSLQSLDLNENAEFDNADLAAFAGHASLVGLYINNSAVTDLSPLNTIATLEKLSIYGPDVVNLDPLLTAPAFNGLHLERNQIADFTILDPDAGGLSLTTFYTSSDVQPGDIDILERQTGLTEFGWSYSNFSTADLERVMTASPGIESLNLTRNAVTDLGQIPVLAPNLRWLDLYEANAPDLSPLYGMAVLENVHIERAALFAENLGQPDVLRNIYFVTVEGTPIVTDLVSNVTFSNAELATCVEDNYPGIVVTSQMSWIDCNGRSAVTDLVGLEDFPRMDGITMNDTSISDLAPILDLPMLNYVSLVNVTLSDPNQVQQLRDRGVQVDGQP
jgi:Leucine-rich repeat (LRR) protein